MSTKKEELDKALASAKAKLEKTKADEKASADARVEASANYQRLVNLARHASQPTFEAKFDKVATAHPDLLKAPKASKPKPAPKADPAPAPTPDPKPED